jgi:hypothetical protein
MSVSTATFIVLLAVLAGCNHKSADASRLDTSAVAVAAPRAPASSGDTVPSMDSVMKAFNAYEANQITAQAAAKVIVDHILGSGQAMNLAMDPALSDAVAREMKNRRSPRD